jgi:hypothetical protein
MESVIYGKPAAEALRDEAERLGAKRVYVIVSRTLNTSGGTKNRGGDVGLVLFQ